MISEELLNEVLDLSTTLRTIDIYQNDITYNTWVDIHKDCTINIHELAHKCKEWALTNNYQLHSALRDNAYPVCIAFHIKGINKTHFKADTEPKAIFAACEWILKETK